MPVPYLLPQGQWHDIAGESYYQDALREIAPAEGPDRPPKDCLAVLRPEPDNPRDPSAIAVWIDGRHVGYLAREHAAGWADTMAEIVSRGYMPVARAKIVGGRVGEVRRDPLAVRVAALLPDELPAAALEDA